MGNWNSQPQELFNFKRLTPESAGDIIVIPEISENRVPTNSRWIIAIIVATVLLFPFLIYTLYYSDIRRLFGYDQCGNICGSVNYHYDGVSCSGKDQTSLPFLQMEESGIDVRTPRSCVEHCKKDYVPELGICTLNKNVESIEVLVYVGKYLKSATWHILISSAVTILITIGVMFLYRRAIKVVVWGCIAVTVVGLVMTTAALWCIYYNLKDNRDFPTGLFVSCWTVSAITVGAFVIFIFLRKKIPLVISILREATEAIFHMPGLTWLPLITLVVLLKIFVIFAVVTLFMFTAGNLEEVAPLFYEYKLTGVMIFTLIYNSVIFLWISNSIVGIQYMIVAGAVSSWYFARDKTRLSRPIMTSTKNVIRFHIGTAVLGGLILTIMAFIKAIVRSMTRNPRLRGLFVCCISSIERFFRFLSKNAYIITAMHGEPLLKSGKRAANLIFSNLKDILAVNFIGDFVLCMTQFFIVLLTLLFAVGLFAIVPVESEYFTNDAFGYGVVGFVSSIIVLLSFGIFGNTIDTLFVCYCEDTLLNDGVSKPYYTSRNMMEFIQNSKQAYAKE